MPQSGWWCWTLSVARHGSNFVAPDNSQPSFAAAGLPWASGSYHRTTLTINKTAVVAAEISTQNLSHSCSQKALFVINVALQDMLIVTDNQLVVPTRAHVAGETAVALAKVVDGKLGYNGDVNAEEESQHVFMTICGLL